MAIFEPKELNLDIKPRIIEHWVIPSPKAKSPPSDEPGRLLFYGMATLGSLGLVR
jgi:hypothetical protein